MPTGRWVDETVESLESALQHVAATDSGIGISTNRSLSLSQRQQNWVVIQELPILGGRSASVTLPVMWGRGGCGGGEFDEAEGGEPMELNPQFPVGNSSSARSMETVLGKPSRSKGVPILSEGT